MTDADLILCELLVLRCQRGDTRAADELVALFEKPLLYYLRRMVGSEADAWDLVQDTWVPVFRALPKLRDARALPAYPTAPLVTTPWRTCATRDVNLRLDAAVESALTKTAHGPVFTWEDATAVHAGLDKLSLPHREALTLFFLQDLTIEEIASVLAIPPGTVKSRLHHAKKALGTILHEGANHDTRE